MYAAHREAEGAAERHAAAAGLGHRRGVLLWLPRLRGLPPRAARGLLVALVPLLWLAAGPVSAEAPAPRTWHVGWVQRADLGPAHSWFWALSPDSTAPDVAIVGPGQASLYCPGVEGPQTCTVTVFGTRWTRITIDGQVVAERGRAYLPMVPR